MMRKAIIFAIATLFLASPALAAGAGGCGNPLSAELDKPSQTVVNEDGGSQQTAVPAAGTKEEKS